MTPEQDVRRIEPSELSDSGRGTSDASIEQRTSDLDYRASEFGQMDQRQRGKMATVHNAPPDTEEVLVFPAGSGQRRLWFIEQADPGSPLYNVARGIRLRGALDLAALNEAANGVVQRHESLRTTFEVADGEPVQVVHAPLPVDLLVEDVSSHPAELREAAAMRLMVEAAGVPFDLAYGPLVRFHVFRLDACDHLLVVAMHHMICDGWSVGVLFNEIAEIYNSVLQQRTPRLADLPLQYGDFAVWEQEHVGEASVHELLDYWTRKLAGAPALNLPVDRARPARLSTRGATVSRPIPPGLADAARALARQHESTLFMTGLALFATLLHRYGGDTDIVIGAPVANREHPEFQQVVGFFVNTLALRLDVAGDPSVAELLGRVRQTVLEGFRHQEVPFEKVIEAVRRDRKGKTAPLFQAMYAFESEWSAVPFRMQGLEATPVEVTGNTAKFDLTLFLMDKPEGMSVVLEFSTDLFDDATAARMLGHFEQLLAAACANPAQAISRLPLLTAGERRLIVEDWNATAADYPRDTPITEIFARQVSRRPEATAVVEGERRVSYAELDRRAAAIAGRLRALGVGRGVPVSLCLSRGVNLIAGMLGVLKAGGVYVPLDPAYPRERLEMQVSDVDARIAIVEAKYRDLFGSEVTLLDVDGDREVAASTVAPGDAAAVPVLASDPAYIIFTSGSTGRPKGTVVTHRGIARLVLNTNYVPCADTDVIAQASNAAFDAATFEIWGALLNGGSVAILPTEAVLSASRLGVEIARQGITTMFLTTSLFHQLAREQPSVFRPLQYLLFGGEAADAGAVAAVLAAGPPRHLVNCYGPTETTTFATTFEVTGPSDIRSGVPIGRPIANTTTYVLDRTMTPVPVGVPGELYIGGDGVALGYHGRPDLTAERFVADPFRPATIVPGSPERVEGRLYRTGDLVRYRSDGNIEFLGRLDNQVKIRGFRVEPGEVESALRGIEGVDEACVLTEKDGAGIARLVAYVGASAGAGVTSAQLRERLKRELPHFMVPSEIAVLERLPINANGKVDRAALKAVTVPASEEGAAVVAPRDPLEDVLVEIWERLLGTSPVGVRDDFFDLGGHSLLAARMIAEVEQRMGRRVPLSVLLEHATIESLANALVQAEYSGQTSPLTQFNEGGTDVPLFFFHGDLNGGGFYCRQLARHLDPNRPLLVLPPTGALSGPMQSTIEGMASVQMAAVRAARPSGPYLVGGYCNGGLVALEVARQLRAAGEAVPLVVIVSASAASVSLAPLDRALRAWAKVRHLSDAERVELFLWMQPMMERLARGTPTQRLRYLAVKALRAARRIVRHRAVEGEAPPPLPRPIAEEPPGDEFIVGRHTTEVWDTYSKAVSTYVPRPFDGRVALFVTGGITAPAEQQAADWRRALPRLEVHAIEGDHMTCITKHVASLAASMESVLETVERSAGS